MDWIHVESLECRVHVGVPQWERRRRQRVLVDLSLGLDLRKAGLKEVVSATVDYAAVAREVKQTVQGRSFRLVEAMAEQAARQVLKRFHLKQIRVRIRKFSVSGTRSVGVEVTRGK